MRELSTLINLKKLSLRNCHYINDVDLQSLSALSNLQQLDVNYCDEITDSGEQILFKNGKWSHVDNYVDSDVEDYDENDYD